MNLFLITLCMLILSALFNFLGGDDALHIYNGILSISAIIMGFGVSSAVFLLGQLVPIKWDFSNPIREIRHNLYLMLSLFVGIFFLLLFKQHFPVRVIIATSFFLQLFAFFEIIKAIFTISSFINEHKKTMNEREDL